MLISNPEGLSPDAEMKVIHPYAKDKGDLVDLAEAGKEAVKFLRENPRFLQDVGDLLD